MRATDWFYSRGFRNRELDGPSLLDRAIFGEVFPSDWPSSSEPVTPPLPANELEAAHEAPAVDEPESLHEKVRRVQQADYLDLEAAAQREAADREAEEFQRMKARREREAVTK